MLFGASDPLHLDQVEDLHAAEDPARRAARCRPPSARPRTARASAERRARPSQRAGRRRPQALDRRLQLLDRSDRREEAGLARVDDAGRAAGRGGDDRHSGSQRFDQRRRGRPRWPTSGGRRRRRCRAIRGRPGSRGSARDRRFRASRRATRRLHGPRRRRRARAPRPRRRRHADQVEWPLDRRQPPAQPTTNARPGFQAGADAGSVLAPCCRLGRRGRSRRGSL